METQETMTMLDRVLAVLLFPRTFQGDVISFALGSTDPLAVEILKRSFLLLPAAALIFCLWASVPNLISILFRSRRMEYLHNFLAAWWDLGYAAFAYLAGLVRALFVLLGQLLGLLRLALAGLWLLLLDILLAPFRAAKSVGRSVAAPGLPWIAMLLTLAWCLLEAVIFTYVMMPLVMDTLSNLTGQALLETSIRIPLFLFLLTLVLGSYAVLAAWTQAVHERNVAAIVRITAVEFVAVLLEVLFLYREFVDALLPWFAMHASHNLEPGAVTILGVAFMVWLGVRGMTWFLFASHGTPVLMALIQGRGLGEKVEGSTVPANAEPGYAATYYSRIRQDTDWLSLRGEELLGAVLVPPLQLLAACVNFLTLLISGKLAFRLPFKDLAALQESAKALHFPARRASNEPSPTSAGADPVTQVKP